MLSVTPSHVHHEKSKTDTHKLQFSSVVLYWQAQFLVRVKKSYFSLALGEIYHLFQELSCHVALGRHIGAKLYHYVRQDASLHVVF